MFCGVSVREGPHRTAVGKLVELYVTVYLDSASQSHFRHTHCDIFLTFSEIRDFKFVLLLTTILDY